MDIINTWQFNLFLYCVFNVIFSQFYKLSLKTVEKDGAVTIILQTIGALSQLLLIPLFAWQTPNKLSIFLLLTAACIFYAINDRLQTTVRKHLEVSIFSILNQLSTVILILYGLTIFNDPFKLTKIIGALLIIVANVWLLYKPSRRKIEYNKYYVLAVIALVSFATAISIDIGISDKFNLPFYIAITLMLPALMVAISEKISLREVRNEFDGGKKKYFIITGVSWGLLILFGLRSFQLGEVTTIVPLQAIAVILNVLAAFLFLNERSQPIKKILAAVIVIIGVYFTVLN